jgi:hypothetical protein
VINYELKTLASGYPVAQSPFAHSYLKSPIHTLSLYVQFVKKFNDRKNKTLKRMGLIVSGSKFIGLFKILQFHKYRKLVD